MSNNKYEAPKQAASPDVVELSFVEFCEAPMRLNANYSDTMPTVTYIRLHLQPWVHVRLKVEGPQTEFVVPISNVRSIKPKDK